MMIQVLGKRLLMVPLLLLAVATLTFLLARFLPGDPAQLLAGPEASQEVVEAIRARYGLDRPLSVQYGLYLKRLLRFDLGRSLRTSRPVRQEILDRYRATLELAGASVTFAVLIGLPLGIVSALHRGRVLDVAAGMLSLGGVSLPTFWVGLVAIQVFSVKLGWLPVAGRGGPAYLILPSATLGLAAAAFLARMVRSGMVEALTSDYVRTARAKGATGRRILIRHALRNVLIPVVTLLGIQFGRLMAGAVVTEAVFAWPGLGNLLVLAISSRDYSLIQGIILTFAFAFVVLNAFVDVMYGWIDPRIRYA